MPRGRHICGSTPPRDESLDVVPPAPSARLADDSERRFADVGQGQRVAGHGLDLRRASELDQLEDDVAVAFAWAAKGAQAVEDVRREPHEPPASYSARSTKAESMLDIAESARTWGKRDVAAQLRLEPVEPRGPIVSHIWVGRHPRIVLLHVRSIFCEIPGGRPAVPRCSLCPTHTSSVSVLEERRRGRGAIALVLRPT